MSRRTPRRAVALVLAASVGLVAASAAQAAPRTGTIIQQQLSGRNWIESTWALLRGFMPKSGGGDGNSGGPPPPGHNPPGNGDSANVKPEGPGLCPIGKPGQPGN
jgi:hypothetical protein